MNKVNLTKGLTFLAICALMTGCSATQQRLSQQKGEIEDQKSAQKAVIDDRTKELKRSISILKKQEVNLLEAQKREPGADRKFLDFKKDLVEKNAEVAKANLDKESAACKTTVDKNAKLLEAELESGAKTHRYQ